MRNQDQFVNQFAFNYRACYLALLCCFLMALLPSLGLAQSLPAADPANAKPCIILLHGLARTADSMQKLSEQLERADFISVNIDYESRKSSIETLATEAVPRGLKRCEALQASSVSFVTHSMGGIIVRQYLSNNQIDNLHRVVMLAPPNRGSSVVDALRDVPGFELLNGPAGLQLGAGSDSLPNLLGPVNFDLGVIAGTSTFNPLLSQLLANPDDGKVSVHSTRVEGMCGFLVVEESHPFIMKSERVIAQVVEYLQTGKFSHPEAQSIDCGQNRVKP